VTVMQIRTLGDPVLRETATPVVVFDETLRRLADDMVETMYAAPGVGLAANQVGLRMSCFVYDDREGHAGFVANPELSDGRPLDIRAEGLLARIFQHETDHLRGMLYIDRLDDEGRRDVMRQLREFEVQRSEP